MSFANHPQVKKLLEKATLESLIKIYFQRVYSRDEIQEMENALKNALDKYSEKEILYDVCLFIIICVFTIYFRNLLKTTKMKPNLC